MNLLIEYFTSTNKNRDNEYLFCIKQNILNPLIEKIYVFISDDSELNLTDKKLVIVKLSTRPTFLDLFKYCNDNLTNQNCIISNTDIFFDESLSKLDGYDMTSKFLSLTRWDIFFDGKGWIMKYYDYPWWDCYLADGTLSEKDSIRTNQLSQDAWIFRSPVKIDNRIDFLMGKPGCDNRISQIMFENGYQVSNPSKVIICKHYHQTNFRTYGNHDLIPGPYLLIKYTEDLDTPSEIKTIPHF